MESTSFKNKPRNRKSGEDSYSEQILSSYIKDVSKYSPIKAEQERILAKRIRAGDKKAADDLVKANLRFVINVANNYSNQGIPLVDLINIGNMGLINAAEKFDERKNFKFISYAVWWIRQAILKALSEQSRVVRLPLHRVAEIMSLRKIKEQLEREYHREPTPEELQKALKMVSPNMLNAVMAMDKPAVSLDTPTELGCTLLDLMTDEDSASDEGVVLLSEKEEIGRHIQTLSKMEKIVVKEYYGLDQEDTKTLAEIGKKYKITRERVRQIREQAIKKLRRSYSHDKSNLMGVA